MTDKRPLCDDTDKYDREMWFDPEQFHRAVLVCRQCPLMDTSACDGDDEEYGVWSGTTPRERGWEHDEDHFPGEE